MRQAAGILQLLDPQGSLRQGARRWPLDAARSLRRDARSGGSGEGPARRGHTRGRLRLAAGQFVSSCGLRSGDRQPGMISLSQPPRTGDARRAFRSTIRAFVRTEFVPHQDRWREQRFPDPDAWTEGGSVGMLLSDVPTEYGGGGGTFVHETVVVEELAREGVPLHSFIHDNVAHYILAYGSEAQKREWLPRMARGELVGAIAMSEPAAGSDLQGITTTARRDGDDYVINGSKTFITNGWHATLVCLAVKTNLKGVSLIMVEAKDLTGYRVGRPLEKVGMHAQDACELFFDNVRVSASSLLGPAEGRGGFQILEMMSY